MEARLHWQELARSLASDAQTDFEVGGTTRGAQYDDIISGGAISLNGTLQITLINGFTPTAGNSFGFLDASSLTGAFTSLQLPALSSGMAWSISQFYTTGVLSVVSTLPGDYNGDGVVDAADYTVWRDNLGRAGMGLAADGNGDNRSDCESCCSTRPPVERFPQRSNQHEGAEL